MIDHEYARKSRPSDEKVRELIGVDDSVKITYLLDVPCLYQGWEVDEWAYVVKDDACNRYLLMSDHCRWYVAEPEELRQLVLRYTEVSQAAIRALVELKEGMGQEIAKLKGKAIQEAGFTTFNQAELDANPALKGAIDTIVSAAEQTLKGKPKGG